MSERTARIALCTMFGVTAFAGFAAGVDASVAEWTSYGRGVQRAHIPLARRLAAATSRVARPVIALVDAGAVAYYSEWTTIDTFGLNDVHIALSGSRDPDYVLAQHPEVVVLVSDNGTQYHPPLPFEGPLHARVVAAGMTPVRVYEFDPTYYLWVFAQRGSVAADALR